MTWIKVAHSAEIPVGGMKKVETEEEDILVYHIQDGWYATSDVCTHAGESLACGTLQGDIIACPKHGGKFEVKTGAAAAFPCVVPVRGHAVELRGDEVWVECED